MYLTFDKNYWALDIEGDPIPSTKIYCAVVQNVVTEETIRLVGEDNVKRWLEEHPEAILVGHTLLGYDIPTLNRLLGLNIGVSRVIDTMLLSMMYQPSIKGGHSLAAWGQRLRTPKGEFDDFSAFSPEMLEYCVQDTAIARLIYITLVNKLKQALFSEKSIKLEHQSWALIQKQKHNGFAFDKDKAKRLLLELRSREKELKDEIYQYWPPSLEPVRVFARARRADGTPTLAFERHLATYPKLEERPDGTYTAYDYVAFNIGSPKQRVEKLLELGWEPQEFTPVTDKGGGGNPKVTEHGKLVPSLRAFMEETDREEIRLIARWIETNARGNMVKNWLDNYNENTGCIHGQLWLANTLRYRHSNPNSANIPGVRLDEDDKPLFGVAGAYTYESRDCWTVRDRTNRVLVGVDAKGIQLRILAEYLNNEAFTEAILSADPHSANRDAWGFSPDKAGRSLAKTIVYATLMGAGIARIASEAKVSEPEAVEAKALFMDRIPEFDNLVSRLKGELKRTGRITLCDGSRIEVSSAHMVIPYLLQGDESRIMRRAAVTTFLECSRRNLDVLKVGDIHDEWQNDVLRDHSSEFAMDVCPMAFAESGRFHNYRIPIECDAQLGMTWAETH